MKVAEAVSSLKEKFLNAGINNSLLDAQLIVGRAANMSREKILTYPDKILTADEIFVINEMTKKRISRMPMQYILGRCEFMGLDFNVNENTLIPRCDTEVLVEKAIKIINGNNYRSLLDIGTGSGAIAVSIAKYTNIAVTALDVSKKALDTAEKNAEINNVNIKFIESNLFENINESFDIIVSNPPYIERSVIGTLEREVKDYEPHIALDGGDDGLDFYRNIISNIDKYLNKNGSIMFEIGYNQGKAVSKLLSFHCFESVEITKDLAGLDRVVTGYNYSK